MTSVLAVGAGLLGLLVGSFLNVVACRVPRGESVVRPRSRCPGCAAPIRGRDNVPVLSWLLLAGRCRKCRRRISPRYPLVELLTGLLFAGVAVRFGPNPALPAYLYLAAVGVALAVIDLDVRRLPDVLTLPSYVVGLVLLGVASYGVHDGRALLRAVLAMAVAYVLYLALALAYRGGMGFGDVKLGGVLGLFTGWLGWGQWAVGLFAGFLLGGVVAIGLVLAGRAGRKTAVPFGPFMLAGAAVAVVAGEPLVRVWLHTG